MNNIDILLIYLNLCLLFKCVYFLLNKDSNLVFLDFANIKPVNRESII